jgi:spore cortex biosynthesis protein YabQ
MYAELVSFAAAVFLGAAMGAFFDLYRAVNYLLRPRQSAVWLMDFVYTLILIAAGFISLVLVNWAEMRLYIFLSLIFGALLYFFYLSRFFYHGLICAADRILCLYIALKRFFRQKSKKNENKVVKQS